MSSWEHLFDGLSEGLFVADHRLRLLYANAAARRLVRVLPEGGSNQSVAACLRAAGFSTSEEELVRHVKKAARNALVLQRDGASGRPPGEVIVSVLPGTNPPLLLGVVRDAEGGRARADFHAERGLCEALIEAVPDGLFVVEPQTRIIIYANEAFHRRRRLRLPLGIGQPCYRLLAREDRPCEERGRACPIPDLIAGKQAVYCALNGNGASGGPAARLSCLVMEGGRLLVVGVEPDLPSGQPGRGDPHEPLTSGKPPRSPSYQEFHDMVAQARKTHSLVDLATTLTGDLQRLLDGSDVWLLLLDPTGHVIFPLSGEEGSDAGDLNKVVKALGSPDNLSALRRELDRLRKGGASSRHGRVPEDVEWVTAPFRTAALGWAGPSKDASCGYLLLSGRKTPLPDDLPYLVETLFAQLMDHLRHLLLEETVPDSKSLKNMALTHPDGIIGRSKRMQEVYELIDLVAASDATVLITGENGTGKELVAQAIHNRSHRRKGPFIVAHCNAYSPTLLESELFGHEKGAFTGAIRRKMGRIERAQGGTLFLDEIGDIAPATQVLLLRFLQDHRFERVGGEKTLEADVRVLAATNRNLVEEVESGRFRDDLYYRLNVISIHLPPLRERKEDIPLLSQYFLNRYSEKEGKKVAGFSSAALQALMDYDWPGNVRQLENAVSHAVILAQDATIRRQHLPRFLQDVHELPTSASLVENEKRLILKVLRQTRWNKHEAARKLQVSRSTLYSKIQRYGLRPDQAV
jgi:DNA-binding NtrC family response regulator